MEIVSVVVEYAGGLEISEGASFDPESETVYLSERLQQLLRECDTTETPPRLTMIVGGACHRLLSHGAQYKRGEAIVSANRPTLIPFSTFGRAWNREQRQQFGRFAHTLSAASIVGAIGYWHSTANWTLTAALNVAVLVFLFVILFLRGMDSMNGE